MKSAKLVVLLLLVLATIPYLGSEIAPTEKILFDIHKRLTNSEKLNYHSPLVFTGEITEFGPIFQGVCKQAVAQEVVFSVSQVLFGTYKDPELRAGYLNCTRVPLPSPPFTLHAKVIVYCEEQHKHSGCLVPVPQTDENLQKVKSWTADLQAAAAENIKRTGADGPSLGHATGAAMLVIHERLQDSQRIAKEQGFVITGVVSRNEEVRQKRCATWGVEYKVAYRVSEVLWNYPDSLLSEGYEISKGFIDCHQSPLPPPFVVGTKVIAYCEAHPGAGYTCSDPVLLTDERLQKVRTWVEELRQREGDLALLQIHQRLHGSLQRSPNHPLLLLGTVSWVEPPQKYHIGSVLVLPTMRVSVSRVLWGINGASEIISRCPSRDCSSVAVGTKVFLYCEDAQPGYEAHMPSCNLSSTAATKENMQKVETWSKEAHNREPFLILDKIRQSLAAKRNDRWVPTVYRGHIESIGKADNGITQLEHFVDTTAHEKRTVNIEFHFPYPHTPVVETGKPMITFCYQKDDVCYAGEEATGIIEDSDTTFQQIQSMIGQAQ